MARTSLPKNYETEAATLYEDFETIGQWTFSGSAGFSGTADTTNFKAGTQGINLSVGTAAGSAFGTKTISTVFAAYQFIRLNVYIPVASTLSNVDIFLSQDSGFTRFLKASYTTGFKVGWNQVVLHKDDFAATGGALWTDTMIRLRIRIDALAGALTSATVDNLQIGGRGLATCILRFDDAFLTQYTVAYPYMAALGLKGTVCANGASVGTGGHMTLANLQEMYAAGWDVVNHGYTHINFTTVDAATKRSLMLDNKNWLVDNGFLRGGDIIVYPNGGYDDETLSVAASLGLKYGYSVLGNTKRTQNYPVEDKQIIRASEALNTSSSATVIAGLTNAAKYGNLATIFYHKLVTTPTVSTEHSIASFNAEMDALAIMVRQGLITVRTMSNWTNSLTNPRG